MKTNKLPPIHPGEILREEFMKPHGRSQNALARALNIPPRRTNEIFWKSAGSRQTPPCGWHLPEHHGGILAGFAGGL
jgi:hypothetical protein